jgi:uncharacterized protein (TIGR04255 family)
MSPASKLKIDLTENFPLLARAPIVEAVLDIRARAEAPWEESAVSERLRKELPDYPVVQSKREIRHEVKIDKGQPAKQSIKDMGWKGLQLQSGDKRHIAQFHRDGFVFSRLQPYQSWNQFRNEALRLWRIHQAVAQPADIHRLGLRFINRILLPKGSCIENYLQIIPKPPIGLELPFAGFFHHETLNVPGYPYSINMVRTMQPPQGSPPEVGAGLILDIDVFTITPPLEAQNAMMEQRIEEMRWLKNRAFFGSITTKALEEMR